MHQYSSQLCDFDQLDDVNWNQDIVSIIRSTLLKLNWIIGRLVPQIPEISTDLCKNYTQVLSDFIENNPEYQNFETNFPINTDELEISANFIPLAKKIGQVIFIYLCNNAKKEDLLHEQVKLPALDTIKAVYYPPYYLGIALMKFLPPNQVYALFREYYRIQVSQRKNKQLDINYLEELAKFYDKTIAETHNFQSFVSEDHKYFMNTTGCIWATALQNAEDHEIMYSLLCHSDYITPIQFNPNFRLTRSKTLIQGDKCCDFCYHDIRYESNLSHPREEDWKKRFSEN